MIKRRFFINARVAHNNNTNKFTWWSGVVTIKGLFVDYDNLINDVQYSAFQAVEDELFQHNVQSNCSQVEIVSLGKI